MITYKLYKKCDKQAIKKQWIEDLVVSYVMEVLNDEKIRSFPRRAAESSHASRFVVSRKK